MKLDLIDGWYGLERGGFKELVEVLDGEVGDCRFQERMNWCSVLREEEAGTHHQ